MLIILKVVNPNENGIFVISKCKANQCFLFNTVVVSGNI